jgi:hypothetical protein
MVTRGELMRPTTTAHVFALFLSGTLVTAQDGKTTTDTKVKSDNGKVVTMAGCLEIGGGTSFVLTNIISEHEQHGRTTAHNGGPYSLNARKGLDLGPYIQQRVELTGVVVPVATRHDSDDKFKITDSSGATTVKVKRGAERQFLVASVKALAPTCQP